MATANHEGLQNFYAAKMEMAATLKDADLETVCRAWVKIQDKLDGVPASQMSAADLGTRQAIQERSTALGLHFTELDVYIERRCPHLLAHYPS